MKLTAEEYDTLQPVVAQVAISLKRKYSMLDRDDLAQEAWVWVVSNLKQVRELLALDDEKEQGRLLHYRIALGARKWAETEKAAALGYEPDDLHFYSNKELGVLVELMFDEDAWLKAPENDSDGPSNRQDPAIGGNWVATLSDVSRAYQKLPQDDALVLHMHFAEALTQMEIAAAFGIAQSTVSNRINRALDKLHEELGGERPDAFAGYTGSRRHMSTAAMNATIRSYT